MVAHTVVPGNSKATWFPGSLIFRPPFLQLNSTFLINLCDQQFIGTFNDNYTSLGVGGSSNWMRIRNTLWQGREVFFTFTAGSSAARHSDETCHHEWKFSSFLQLYLCTTPAKSFSNRAWNSFWFQWRWVRLGMRHIFFCFGREPLNIASACTKFRIIHSASNIFPSARPEQRTLNLNSWEPIWTKYATAEGGGQGTFCHVNVPMNCCQCRFEVSTLGLLYCSGETVGKSLGLPGKWRVKDTRKDSYRCSLWFDRLSYILSDISGVLFEHFESACTVNGHD